MEKQETKSKWDELARELGAEISPETERREEAVSTAQDSGRHLARQPSAPPAAVRPSPKRAAGWDSLASDFGLPTAEPARSAAQEPAAIPKQVAVPRPPAPERPKRERPVPERRESFQKQRGPRPATANVDDVSETATQEREAPAVPVAEPREKTAPSGAAVSLWHKIFGSPAEQAVKLTEAAASGEDAADRLEVRGETQPVTSGGFVQTESVVEATEVDIDEEVFGGADDTTESDPADRTRRRSRRRRRGRGRKGSERPAESHPSARRREPSPRRRDAPPRTEPDELDDDFEEVVGPDHYVDDIASDQLLDVDAAIENDADNVDDAEAGTTTSSRGRSVIQRSIPSWEEAIGFIVDVNMQARSQRRQSSHASSRGNSSRGRSRGGRRKK